MKKPSQEETYRKIPFMTFQGRQNYSDRELLSGFRFRRNWLQRGSIGSFGGVMECSVSWLQWWLHKSIHVLKFVKLYTKNKSFSSRHHCSRKETNSEKQLDMGSVSSMWRSQRCLLQVFWAHHFYYIGTKLTTINLTLWVI